MQFFIFPKYSDDPTGKIDPHNTTPFQNEKNSDPPQQNLVQNFSLSPPPITEEGVHAMTVFFKLLQLYVTTNLLKRYLSLIGCKKKNTTPVTHPDFWGAYHFLTSVTG